MAQNYGGYKSKNAFSTFLLCWTAYFSTYVCRLNFSAAMPELQAGNVFSESRIAAVSSVFFICYGIGQFISGLVGERLDTRKMVFTGLFLSAICNIGIFFLHTYAVLLLLWAINGAAQSMVWSPILKIGSMNFDTPTRTKFGIDMSTTVPVGTLLSYLISLVTLAFFPWHYVFLTCGLFELCIALVWIFGTKGRFLVKSPKATTKDAVPPVSAKETFRLMLSGGVLFMMIPIVMQAH